MNRTVTFGHILTILGIVVVPLMIWGVNVERRFETVRTNKEDIKELNINHKVIIQTINNNHLETLEKLHLIDLKVQEQK